MAKTLTTPKGELKWVYANEPDTKFDEEGVYRCELVLPSDHEFLKTLDRYAQEAWDTMTKEMKPALKSQAKLNKPYVMELDAETGDPTGNVLVRFKSKAVAKRKDGTVVSLKPQVCDASGKLVQGLRVGNGSIGKVGYRTNPYFVAGQKAVGVSLYFVALQVLELEEFNSNPFQAEEGSFIAGSETQTTSEPGDEDVAW